MNVMTDKEWFELRRQLAQKTAQRILTTNFEETLEDSFGEWLRKDAGTNPPIDRDERS